MPAFSITHRLQRLAAEPRLYVRHVVNSPVAIPPHTGDRRAKSRPSRHREEGCEACRQVSRQAGHVESDRRGSQARAWTPTWCAIGSSGIAGPRVALGAKRCWGRSQGIPCDEIRARLPAGGRDVEARGIGRRREKRRDVDPFISRHPARWMRCDRPCQRTILAIWRRDTRPGQAPASW